MILIVLFGIGLVVWLGSRWFISQESWQDMITFTTMSVNGGTTELFFPSKGILIFLFVGLLIVCASYLWSRAHASEAIDAVHGKQSSFKLLIQRFPRTMWIDSMNDNMEPLAAWLAPVLARIVVIGFIAKFILGVLLLLLASMLPADNGINPTTILAQPDIVKRQNIDLLLVIDNSGSMSDSTGSLSKIELAKDAAIRALQNMQPNDNVGIAYFSDTAEWAIPPQKLQSDATITKALELIQVSDGGTSINSGLQLALSSSNKLIHDVRHVILLTDGMDPTPNELLASALWLNKVSLSTVALGQDADVATLRRLAELGHGKAYVVNDPQMLPTVFIEDTSYIASRGMDEADLMFLDARNISLIGIGKLLLKFATDTNGMLLFCYGLIVWIASVLYKREQVFIRDYNIMQQQLNNKSRSS